MFVDIKDYGTILYSYFPKEESTAVESKANRIIEKLTTRATEDGSSGNLLGLETAVIINQQHQDYGRQRGRDAATIAQKALENCGILCKPNNNPSLEFFRSELFTYDIVFYITHGEWDPVQKIHWLFTSENPSTSEKEDFDKDDLYKYKNYDRDKVSLLTGTENRNGTETTVTYVIISEKFLKEETTRNFNKFGKAIFFNVACQSMMGDYPKEIDENKRSTSLAEILEDKGVGFYLGYDETNGAAQRAGMLFFAKLASGMSLRYAYESLPQDCLEDKLWGDAEVYDESGNSYTVNNKSWTADLLPYPSYKNGIIGISNNCITSTTMEKYVDESTEKELKVIFKAKSPLYYDVAFLNTLTSTMQNDYKNQFDFSKYLYGFEFSTNEDFKDAKRTKGMAVNTTGCSLSQNKVNFTQKLTSNDLKSNTTYYYRAYFYDGFEYHFSRSDSFKTKTTLGGSGTEIPDVPGSEL
jgi:hypothetical protein